jgi:hypothetical protein
MFYSLTCKVPESAEYLAPLRLHPSMRTLVLLALAAASTAAAAEPLRFSSGSSRVALIELYTSEGCSSCPPADQWLGALREKPGLWSEFVPVEFHVNYWDSLGWKDRLASRSFTEREYAYASVWGSPNVYTPCFVRNGSEWKPQWGLAGTSGAPAGVLTLELADGTCRAKYRPPDGAPDDGFEIHLALLGGGLSSKVTAGENGGETLKHDFVVLGLAQKGLVVERPAGVAWATLSLPTPSVGDAKRRAVAAWVTRRGDPAPVQATGGWLP